MNLSFPVLFYFFIFYFFFVLFCITVSLHHGIVVFHSWVYQYYVHGPVMKR